MRSFEQPSKLIRILFKQYNTPFPHNNHAIIISAMYGCSDCTKLIDNFIKINIKNKKFTSVIITSSNKDLFIRFSKNTLENKNMIIDKEKLSMKLRIIYEKHLIIYLSEGKIQKMVMIDSSNITAQLKSFQEFLNS